MIVVTPSAKAAPPASGPAPARGARPRRAGGRSAQPSPAALRARADALARRERLMQRALLAAAALAVLAGVLWLARAPILRELAERPGVVGAWALDELVELRDPASFPLFVRHFLEDTETYHLVVFEVGGRARAPSEDEVPPDDPEAVAAHQRALLAALADPERDVRGGALRALYALKERAWAREPALLAAAAHFLALSEEPTPSPREEARERRFAALVLREANPVPPVLRDAALRDPDRLVRRFAVEAFGRGEGASVEVAREVLETALRDPAPEVVRAAHLGLVRIGAEVSFELLAELLEDEPGAMRPEVLRALRGRPEPEATRLLVRGLEDAAPGARLAAVEGLADREGEAARLALERALRDPEPSVRLKAAEALGARADGAAAEAALTAALERHEGWHELRGLHHALERVTGVDLPDPTQGEPASWERAIEGWRRRAARETP